MLIVTKLEQYDYAGATAIAVVMLLFRSCCSWRSICCSAGSRVEGNDGQTAHTFARDAGAN